ncbi:PQQ-dependent sugar dehydrogenase [Piscinibacter sp. XHJ-5]|uniref:PQQ-dependent sugar dehydrogenase n=1 Tax=Piscinibacter sp. XHJ-5 TaxID=3037797 RepID=UPI00245306C0|nr:PQQ-dependent sugar dehydrogenase [Piscinibacter sp. XHJ-5]
MLPLKTLSALALVATLSACGGGGSGAPAGNALSASLTTPADLAGGLTGALALAATAAGDVAAVEFEVDGAAVGEDGSAPYEASVDTGLYAAGQHVVRARARDAAGHRSAWSTATVSFGGSAVAPAGFTRLQWISGLSRATAFAQAPDGRFFVCEQGGVLRVVRNGALTGTPFHTFQVDDAGERGLLGVALHPDFASNGWVYVYYTATSPGTHNRISRLVASGDVSSGMETVLVDLPDLSGATNHNGGALHFGPDGKLYAAVGDNANSARAPDLADVFGKMLRFNDDGTIPADNPFCGTAGTQRCAIWARGLRNPFTFAFQPGTGRLHINDVGEGTWEEINVGAAGADHGWPASEGPTSAAGIAAPLFAYRHSAASPAGSGPGGFFVGFAIAGGAFYPDAGPFPAGYRGNYFFADYGNRWIGRLDATNGHAAYAFGSVGDSPVDMLVGADGALHVLTRSGITRFSAP